MPTSGFNLQSTTGLHLRSGNSTRWNPRADGRMTWLGAPWPERPARLYAVEPKLANRSNRGMSHRHHPLIAGRSAHQMTDFGHTLRFVALTLAGPVGGQACKPLQETVNGCLSRVMTGWRGSLNLVAPAGAGRIQVQYSTVVGFNDQRVLMHTPPWRNGESCDVIFHVRDAFGPALGLQLPW